MLKRKGKEEYLYSAFFAPRYTQSAQAWITQFYLQTTPCLTFLCGVHQMWPPQQLRQQTSNCSSLIYRPRKDERLSWPSWLTYSGWLTHISGHPSATGRAQDSESTSLALDECVVRVWCDDRCCVQVYLCENLLSFSGSSSNSSTDTSSRLVAVKVLHRDADEQTRCVSLMPMTDAQETCTRKKLVPGKTGNGFWYVWQAILHRFFLVPDSGIG